MTPKSYKPVPKVMNGAIGGVIASLLIWFLSESGYNVTPEAASLLTAAVYFGVAYMTPPSPAQEWRIVETEEKPVDNRATRELSPPPDWDPFEEANKQDE